MFWNCVCELKHVKEAGGKQLMQMRLNDVEALLIIWEALSHKNGDCSALEQDISNRKFMK